MRLYLDDDSASPLLGRLLRSAGHDVALPRDVGNLALGCGGHHAGILVVRQDNDPTRDMTARGIVRAIRNLEASGVAVLDTFHVLNHWR